MHFRKVLDTSMLAADVLAFAALRAILAVGLMLLEISRLGVLKRVVDEFLAACLRLKLVLVCRILHQGDAHTRLIPTIQFIYRSSYLTLRREAF